MESVTLNCGVCLTDVLVKANETTRKENLYIVPFLSLIECNHALCVHCVKNLQTSNRRAISCPMCREVSTKFRLISINNNELYTIDCTANSIQRHTSTQCNINMNIPMLVSHLFPFSLRPNDDVDFITFEPSPDTNEASTSASVSTVYEDTASELYPNNELNQTASASIDPDHTISDLNSIAPDLDSTVSIENNQERECTEEPENQVYESQIAAVAQISHLQNEIDRLNEEHNSALDLARDIGLEIRQLLLEKSSHELSVRNLTLQENEKTRNIEQLTEQKNQLESSIQQLIKRENLKKIEIRRLSNKLKQMADQLQNKEKLKKLNESIAKKHTELNQINDLLSHTQSLNDILLAQHNNLHSSIKIKSELNETSISELFSKLENKKTFLEQANIKLRTENDELNAINKRLTQENLKLKREREREQDENPQAENVKHSENGSSNKTKKTKLY